MKNFILLISLLTYSLLYSQTNAEKITRFQIELNSVTTEYRTSSDEDKDKRITQYKLQNERLTKAFNQVVFGNSNLVENASAFGLSQNEEKSNVSVNSNFHLWGVAKRQLFLKAGINANGSGSVFNLYSRNEWKNSIGGSLGLIYKFKGSTFTKESKSKLDYNNILRDVFVNDSIQEKLIFNSNLKKYKESRKKYTKHVELMSSSLDEKYKDVNEKLLIDYYKDLKEKEDFFVNLENKLNKKNELKFVSYLDAENSKNDSIIQELLKTLWSGKIWSNKVLRDLIREVAAEYDRKYIINTGYSFYWFDFNVTLNNDSFGFSDKADNIKSDIKDEFDAFDAEKTDINKLNTVLSLNYNYNYNNFKGAFYFQAGLQFNSGSFLSSNLINGTPKISNKDANGLFIIKDDEKKETDQRILGDFNAINQNLQYGSLNGYVAYFFGEKKIFGLNLGVSHRDGILVPENTFYEKNYSILFGPIFRKPVKDDYTGLTFGIDVGFDNALYSADAKDNFVARIRVGIPLKLYNIKK